MRQMPNLRYTARARPHNLQRRLIRIRSRGSILTLSGVRLLASSFAICLRNLTFCASVVMVSVVSVRPFRFLPETNLGSTPTFGAGLPTQHQAAKLRASWTHSIRHCSPVPRALGQFRPDETACG